MRSKGFLEGLGKCFSEIYEIKTDDYSKLGTDICGMFETQEKIELGKKADEIIEYMMEQDFKVKNGWNIISAGDSIFLTDGEFFIKYKGKEKIKKTEIGKLPEVFDQEEDWENFKESFKEELNLQ